MKNKSNHGLTQQRLEHSAKLKRRGLFAQCDICQMWVEVSSEGFIPLMKNEELTKENWVCQICWDNCCIYGYEHNRRIVLPGKFEEANKLIAANKGLPHSVYENFVKTTYSKEEFTELKQILREEFVIIGDVKFD
jgi:hypothetical protein